MSADSLRRGGGARRQRRPPRLWNTSRRGEERTPQGDLRLPLPLARKRVGKQLGTGRTRARAALICGGEDSEARLPCRRSCPLSRTLQPAQRTHQDSALRRSPARQGNAPHDQSKEFSRIIEAAHTTAAVTRPWWLAFQRTEAEFPRKEVARKAPVQFFRATPPPLPLPLDNASSGLLTSTGGAVAEQLKKLAFERLALVRVAARQKWRRGGEG